MMQEIKCINHGKVSRISSSIICNENHHIFNNSYTLDFSSKRSERKDIYMRYVQEDCIKILASASMRKLVELVCYNDNNIHYNTTTNNSNNNMIMIEIMPVLLSFLFEGSQCIYFA